ncbi:MAG: protein kinase, partial [Candidatus Acidiferrales bacterium]
MIGKTLSHYRIVEKIGAGGMGEVYRARDEHLGRDVAIKVLPAGTLADEQARKRFRKEALSLSKLNHPNIATVFDFDTQDGTDFLVMELVEGVTLSDKLAGGPLPEKEITRLGLQLAEALEEAHERGVVHRDLKPGNVMVTPKGQAKILDFGLAKLLRPDVASATATTESFTETQAAAGTLPYMAPEQVRAENVDARSDIYAAGAVLYEMATGQRAFPETQTGRLMDAILNRAPQPPSGLNRRVSPGLEGIILKALEKEPENRYQSAKELAVDLRRLGIPGSAAAVLSARRPATRRRMVWAAGVALVALLAVLVGLNVGGLRERLLGGVVPGQITSLAVLPLENLMGDPEQDYCVAGMHEALITELSKIGALTVISRTSAMRYRNTDKSVPEIARELGVDAVVEGSVLRVENTVRITAQLIEAATDRHLWADNFDRELRDILALHSDVARAIARQIRVTLTPKEESRLAAARPVNPEAFE